MIMLLRANEIEHIINNNFVTVNQAAKFAKRTRQTINNWIRRGKFLGSEDRLPVIKLFDRQFIDKRILEDYIK